MGKVEVWAIANSEPVGCREDEIPLFLCKDEGRILFLKVEALSCRVEDFSVILTGDNTRAREPFE